MRFDNADTNGGGFVYNKSDCGRPNVRMYAFGGDAPGSACGRWLLEKDLETIWSNGDYNWPQGEFWTPS